MEVHADDTNGPDEGLEVLRRTLADCHMLCGACSEVFELNAGDVTDTTLRWATEERVLCGLQCPDCLKTTCPSCRKVIAPDDDETPPTSCNLVIASRPVTIQYCCDGGRTFALWALACGWSPPAPDVTAFERMNITRRGLRRTMATAIRHMVAPNPLLASGPQLQITVTPFGDGPSLSGNHFASLRARLKTLKAAVSSPTEAEKLHHIHQWQEPETDWRARQAKYEAYLRLTAALLPSAQQDSAFDEDPPAYLMENLGRSPLFELAASLLGNDSVGDIADQCSLYDGVLDFVGRLSDHPATSSLVEQDRKIYHRNDGSLLAASFGGSALHLLAPASSDTSLTALLSRQAAHCQVLLRVVRANDNEAELYGQRGSRTLAWCDRIVQMAAEYEEQRVAKKSNSEAAGQDLDAAAIHRLHAFDELDDNLIIGAYDAEIKAILESATSAGTQRGRMRRLITDVAGLKTSLPEGIYVRHASSRLDALRVLIYGPRHTPYEFGFFEFDLVCPSKYPQQPPIMKFRTTGQGTVRFNPNLYQDGMICLSLLDTWNGERWDPARSTLLQVLVSIQGLVLGVDEPWYNEPNVAPGSVPQTSADYNRRLRDDTLRHAIAPWVGGGGEAPPQPADAIWRPVVEALLRADAPQLAHVYNGAQKGLKSWLTLRRALVFRGYITKKRPKVKETERAAVLAAVAPKAEEESRASKCVIM